MRAFSASEAAFEGFRIIRTHPAAVAMWAFCALALQLAITGLMFSLLGPRLAQLSQYSGAGATMSPEAAAQFSGSMFSSVFLMFPLGLVFSAIFLGAVFRPVLRPQDKGLLYLKIGRDELNLFLLQLAWIGIFIVIDIALVIGAIVIGVGFAAATGGTRTMTQGVGSGLVIGGLVVLCALIWLFVRFSLAAPMTFAEQRVRVFGSWGLTRGRFWSLLGCYLLAGIFGLIISLVGSIVVGGIVGAMFGVGMAPMPIITGSGAGALAMAHMLTLGGMAQLLISAVFSTIGNVVMIGAVAAAYRALTATPEEDVFSDAPVRPAGQGLVL